MNTEALKYFQGALQVEVRATRNAETDTNLAATFYMVGCCYSDINQSEKPPTFFEKSLKIEKRTAVDAASDKNLLLTMKKIERCSLKLARNWN